MAFIRIACLLLLSFIATRLFYSVESRSLGQNHSPQINSDKKGQIYCYDTIEYFTDEVCYQGRCVLVNFTRSKPICVAIGFVGPVKTRKRVWTLTTVIIVFREISFRIVFRSAQAIIICTHVRVSISKSFSF